MTAKKMADIFFGKFSELISPKFDLNEKKIDSEIPLKLNNKNNLIKKILIYSVIAFSMAFIAYYFLA